MRGSSSIGSGISRRWRWGDRRIHRNEEPLPTAPTTSGPDGVLVASVVWEADAVTIRVAVRATQLTDELAARTWEGLDHQLGHVAGYTLAATAPVLLLSGAGGDASQRTQYPYSRDESPSMGRWQS